MDSRKHFTRLRLGVRVRVLGPWMLAATASHALSPPAGASACGELVTAEVAAGIELEQISSHVDAEVLARFVLNAWQGTLIRTKVVKTEEPFRDFNALVFDVLLA